MGVLRLKGWGGDEFGHAIIAAVTIMDNWLERRHGTIPADAVIIRDFCVHQTLSPPSWTIELLSFVFANDFEIAFDLKICERLSRCVLSPLHSQMSSCILKCEFWLKTIKPRSHYTSIAMYIMDFFKHEKVNKNYN